MTEFYNAPDFPRINPFYVKSTVRGNGKWKCDQWDVMVVNGEISVSFDYYMGMGLRIDGKPVFSSIPSFLHSLILDYDAGCMTFTDFVYEYGYPLNTREEYQYAKNIHYACIDTMNKVNRVFTSEQIEIIRENTQDC